MCTICNNTCPNCPCCAEPTTRYKECPECNGTGTIYFSGATGEEIEPDEYVYFTKNGFDAYYESCPKCNGAGEIEDQEVDFETYWNL